MVKFIKTQLEHYFNQIYGNNKTIIKYIDQNLDKKIYHLNINMSLSSIVS